MLTIQFTIHLIINFANGLDIWQSTTKEVAVRCLEQWYLWADESMIKPMLEVAKLLRRQEENNLTYFDMPISNGITEGFNNKDKVISHRAYGFRTAKNYILNLYHCMADRTMTTTLHSFV